MEKEQNNKWIIYSLLTFAVIGLIWVKDNYSTSLGGFSFSSPTPAPTPALEGKRTSADAFWDLYTNSRLEFFIKLPKEDLHDGPVEIFEKENTIYFVAKNNLYYPKVQEALKKESDIERVVDIPWALIERQVRTAKELDQFIKDKYGKECATGKIKRSPQPGVYDVAIGGRMGPEHCFVNLTTFIKYSPSKQKVISWDLGKNPMFTFNDGKPADQDMVRSFMFFR